MQPALVIRTAVESDIPAIAALLDMLHRRSGSADDKNDCLKALVREARDFGPEADTALTLLLLAMWPGLDAVRRRSLGL